MAKYKCNDCSKALLDDTTNCTYTIDEDKPESRPEKCPETGTACNWERVKDKDND